ncbi:hypothetical protein D3C75_544590 [compost metagenome]
MNDETFYVVEVIRKADDMAFMLFGTYSSDVDDSWFFDQRGASMLTNWARLPSIIQIGEHMDHNQWLIDFIIPEMRKLQVRYPLNADHHMEGVKTGTHRLCIYKVNMRASLNLRFKPMVCQTFHLVGEPFIGAIKQGYTK